MMLRRIVRSLYQLATSHFVVLLIPCQPVLRIRSDFYRIRIRICGSGFENLDPDQDPHDPKRPDPDLDREPSYTISNKPYNVWDEFLPHFNI